MRQAEKQAEELLAEPGVTLNTERKFVVNTFVALKVFKDLMKEHGCTNLGVANCMGTIIRVLDTPPCMVFSLLNYEGYTAFCHTDYTHTAPGVLLRWHGFRGTIVDTPNYPARRSTWPSTATGRSCCATWRASTR